MLAIGLAGVVFFALFRYHYLVSTRPLADAALTKGIVVSARPIITSDDVTTVVSVAYLGAGRELVLTDRVSGVVQVGKAVDVSYLPDEPETAKLLFPVSMSTIAIWILVASAVIYGMAFFAFDLGAG